MFKVGKLVTSILSVVVVFLVYYITLPPLSPAYFSGFCFLVFCVLVVVGNICVWLSDHDISYTFRWKPLLISLIVVITMIIIGGIVGSRLFNAMRMQQQLGEVQTIEYNEMIQQIDNSQIPIVDQELANKQADKKIGEDIALGSRVDLGNPDIQEVNGEILYVAPLEHSGIFKWFSNNSTPGYITVSASNPNKVNFVTKLDGKDINILYQESAYFSKDLKRHIRNQGYRGVGLTEYTFEIDDLGMPYWVVTTYENTTLWGNSEATGVIIVDAQTGETNRYSIADTPEWVDTIQPKFFIESQIDNWGKLIHGFFNFSNKDKIEKTDLTLEVYMNGDCYYFTGMTSVGNDESCVGFMMVNTRDKSAQMCYMSGATETAAMKSAEGLVSNYGYVSTEPLPLNVNGIPTYVMALKDAEGLIKLYAMVNIENYSISAKGGSLAETSREYIQSVTRNSGSYVVSSEETFGYTYEGIIERIADVVEDGSTYYYLVVEGESEKIFTASYTVSNELSITQEGDKVKLTYIDDQNETVDIITFDNIAFATPTSEEQEKRDKFDENTSVVDSEHNQIIEVNPDINEETWNSLSDEEKAKILEQFLEEDSN